MSALARYFKYIGKNVAGYDKTGTPLTQELTAMGMDIHYEDDVKAINDIYKRTENTLIVYTPAVPSSHSEYQYFLANGFEVKNLDGGYKTYKQAKYQLKLVTPKAPAVSTQTTNAPITNQSKAPMIELDACGLQCPGPILKVKQAIDQMELLGHTNFFVFYNAQTEAINVLYRRYDGTLGLIQPHVG